MTKFIPFKRKKNNEVKNPLFSVLEEILNDISPEMKADIKETSREYIIEVELPGANKNEINVEVEYEKVIVSVASGEENIAENQNYIRKERKYESRSRSFHVPNIKSDEAKAGFNNGVLTIILPKRQMNFEQKKSILIE